MTASINGYVRTEAAQVFREFGLDADDRIHLPGGPGRGRETNQWSTASGVWSMDDDGDSFITLDELTAWLHMQDRGSGAVHDAARVAVTRFESTSDGVLHGGESTLKPINRMPQMRAERFDWSAVGGASILGGLFGLLAGSASYEVASVLAVRGSRWGRPMPAAIAGFLATTLLVGIGWPIKQMHTKTYGTPSVGPLTERIRTSSAN